MCIRLKVTLTLRRWLNSQGGLHASMFNPDRFLTEEGQKVGSFVPFGIGPRVCPGNALSMAEQKVRLAATDVRSGCIAALSQL